MSNETELDWLARNVHEWPMSTIDGEHSETLIWIEPRKGDVKAAFCRNPTHCFDRNQWLARRAELQNKPSWEDAPEWSKYLMQINTGAWVWADSEDLAIEFGGSDKLEFSGSIGIVLGDWRDTLERRPRDLPDEAVTGRLTETAESVMAASEVLMSDQREFDYKTKPLSVANETKPMDKLIAVAGTDNDSAAESALLIGRVINLLSTSIDHFSADELADLNALTGAELTSRDAAVCGGQSYIDEHWFERGELPPAGVWCEAYCGGAEPEKCKILAYHKRQVAVQWSKFNQGCLDVLEMDGWSFRPIRSERDKAIERMMKDSGALPCDTTESIMLNLYDAGYRKEEK